MGRLSKGEQEGGGGRGGEFFRRFRSQIIFKYTSAVRSKIYMQNIQAAGKQNDCLLSPQLHG